MTDIISTPDMDLEIDPVVVCRRLGMADVTEEEALANETAKATVSASMCCVVLR